MNEWKPATSKPNVSVSNGEVDTHVVITGVKSRSHLIYIASYLHSLLETGATMRVSLIEAPPFLAAHAVDAHDARAMFPHDSRLSIESGMPGWRFARGARAIYVAVGSPGLKASLALRRANPCRRITCVVTDEGIGTYGSFVSRRDAIMRQGITRSKASLRAGLVGSSSRLLTSQRWAAYVRDGERWQVNPAIADEFRREVTGATPGTNDLAVILTQPFVDLGLCDEVTYCAYVTQLAAAARVAGLRPVVRPHPAERRGRYDDFDVMTEVGTAELDPEVISATAVLGGPSTALINLAAMFDARTIWVSEPSLTYLDTDISRDQAQIFTSFLGASVPLATIEDALRAVQDA